jgi:hypothetical protein
LLQLRSPLNSLEFLLLCRGLHIDFRICWKSDERFDGHVLRNIPLQTDSVILDLGVLCLNLGIAFTQTTRKRYALSAYDDAIQIAPMIRLNYIAREYIFTDVGSIEYSNVWKGRVPRPVAKRNDSCGRKNLDFRGTDAAECLATNDQSWSIRKQRTEDGAERCLPPPIFSKYKGESTERYIPRRRSTSKPAYILDRNNLLKHSKFRPV